MEYDEFCKNIIDEYHEKNKIHTYRSVIISNLSKFEIYLLEELFSINCNMNELGVEVIKFIEKYKSRN